MPPDHFKTHAVRLSCITAAFFDIPSSGGFPACLFGIITLRQRAARYKAAAVVLRTVSAVPEGLRATLSPSAVRDLRPSAPPRRCKGRPVKPAVLREACGIRSPLAGTRFHRCCAERPVPHVGLQASRQNHCCLAAGTVDPSLQRRAQAPCRLRWPG